MTFDAPKGAATLDVLPNFKIGEKDIKAETLYRIMCTYDFIFFLQMSRDILPELARLSKSLQARSEDFTLLTETVPKVAAKLEGMIANPGPCQLETDALVQACVDAGHTRAAKPSHASRNAQYREKNRVIVLKSLHSELTENMAAATWMAAAQRLLHTRYTATLEALHPHCILLIICYSCPNCILLSILRDSF